jgi:pimeloyl-ACP methyl ester carboxylesterase
MGRSGWREHYVFEQFVREAREAGRAGGAFDAGKPVVVGHSFGGRAAMGLSRDFGPELRGAVMVDPPFFARQNIRPPSPPRPAPRARAACSIRSPPSSRASA